MRTQSEMLSDKPDDPEGGVRGPPDEGEGDGGVVVEAGNLEYLQSHVVDRNSLLSEREVEKFCGQDGKRLYSQPSEN